MRAMSLLRQAPRCATSGILDSYLIFTLNCIHWGAADCCD